MNKKRLPTWLRGDDFFAVSLLLLLIALRFLPPMLDGRLYAPFRDNVFIYGPMFSETARIALHGQHPFYLPSFGTGFPLFQSPHYSSFYPFYFFGILDYGGPLQSLYTLTYLSIFHRGILALNLYVMLRAARVSPPGALVGASLGVCAYNTEVYSAWITITASYTWLPLLIAGGILLLRNPERLLGVVLLGLSAGLLALASASQAIAHALIFSLIFFGAGFVWLLRRRGAGAVFQLCLSLLTAGVIAFGIGAVSAIPVYLGIDDMVRHIGHGFIRGHQIIPWSRFNETQMALKDWAAIFVNPGVVEVVGSPYTGPLGFAGLALVIIFFRGLDALQKFLAITIGAIGIYGLCSAFGTHLGFSYVNYHLPFINKIREAGRHLVLFVMASVFLTGLGFDQLSRFWKGRGSLRHISQISYLSMFSLPLICAAMIIWELYQHRPLAAGGAIVLLLGPITIVGGLLCRNSSALVFALYALFVSFASAVSPPRMSFVAGSEYATNDNINNLETLSLFRSKLSPGDFRIDFVDKKTSPFTWGMNASYFGFDSFYNRLTPQPYAQFRFSLRLNPPILHEMMGARYVVCAPGERARDPLAKQLFVVNGYTIFENPKYMRRLTVIHSLAGTYSDEAQFITKIRRGFDFRHGVYLMNDDALKFRSFLEGSSPAVRAPTEMPPFLSENSVNRISSTVTLDRPGVVVLNEWYSAAWKAKVNGVAQNTIRVNQWQVGLPLSVGKSVVEFIYRPSLCWRLLLVNRVTWCVLALLVGGILLRTKWDACRPGCTALITISEPGD